MKRFIFLCLILGGFGRTPLFAQHAVGQKACNGLPEFWQLQYAGNIGFVSAGLGYGFVEDKVRAFLIYGYVPKSFAGSTSAHLFTLKSTVRLIEVCPAKN